MALLFVARQTGAVTAANASEWKETMALSKKPITGMKDILPEEMEIRDYVIGVIKETYRNFGFTSIETPCVENLANLNCKAGGENEKLIFKILKRGEKLRLQEAHGEDDLVDGGLRYDLTVPLVRYYANHANELPAPFKALQIGNVWRADRPQRGRYRQFMQCDIDILGEAGNLAEIELILATTTTLGRLGFRNFNIRINDRQILKAMASYSGFAEEDYDQIFIILDKMDKIGTEGVQSELMEAGFPEESVKRYMELYRGLEETDDALSYIAGKLEQVLPAGAMESFREIIDSVEATKRISLSWCLILLWCGGCPIIRVRSSRSTCRNSAAAAGAAADMTGWSASLPDMMCRPVDFPSVLKESSCCFWRADLKCRVKAGRLLTCWRRAVF